MIRYIIQNKRIVYLLSEILFVCGIAITAYLHHLDSQTRLAVLRDHVLSQAGVIRVNLEHEINTSLNLTLGLAVYIASHPDISQTEFESIAKRIVGKAHYIQNIGLARDNVISHIYPLQGNEKALGFHYLDSPEQRDAVVRAIETRNTVIAGPVKLVQGGTGLISRMPIFLDNAQTQYWGMASLVIQLDAFFHKVGIDQSAQNLRIALRGKDSTGESGEVFYGKPELFQQRDTVLLPISLPQGSWQLAAMPRDAWSPASGHAIIIWGLGLAVSTTLSILLFGLLNSMRALSEAKQKVELANEQKARFFSHMTHELRTPLTAIQGVVGLLAGKRLQLDTAKIDELLQNALRNCTRLQWIINDMLDLKKLESGSSQYNMIPLAIREVIADAVDEVEQFARQYNMELVIEDQVPESVRVLADKPQLRQVLANLLANAIKYSPAQSTIRVIASTTTGVVRVEVIDQGEGISENRIEGIFNEFSQDKPTDKAGIASTGLGLSISKHIIQQHGGTIGCHNLPEGGCCFFFTLPVQAS